MDPLFSHAPRPEAEARPARGRNELFTVAVPAPQDIAYGAFTGDLHLWWPADQTVFGQGTHPALEGDVLGEESEDGRVALWARVVDEDAPHSLVLDWVLGGDLARPARVVVDTVASGEGTSLTLRVEGGAPAMDAEDPLVLDWAAVLGRFAAFFGQPSDSVIRG